MRESPLDSRQGIRALFSDWQLWITVIAIAVLAIAAGFQIGRREEAKPRKIIWFSELSTIAGGPPKYVIDVEVKCPGGQILGRVQADLNLKTNALRVVRNDPGDYATCPAYTPPAPAPDGKPPQALPPAGAFKPKAKK